jgi:transposase
MRAELADALHGRIRSHHRFLIGQHLKTIEQLEETIAAFHARIEAALEPFGDAFERLKQVPGLSGTPDEAHFLRLKGKRSPVPT